MIHDLRSTIHGTVVSGKGEGRKLGYPTANIKLSAVSCQLSARAGVYSTIVTVAGRRYPAAAIVGMWQERHGPSVEVHLLDFSGDLLGQEITVELKNFLRPLRKFKNNEELKKQIEKDLNHIIRSTEHKT